MRLRWSMNLAKKIKLAKKLYGVDVSARETDRSVVLTGSCNDWQTVVAVGKLFVDKRSGKHVVNDMTSDGFVEPAERLPLVSDNSLDGTSWDVVIVGGGVSGCAVARELARYDIRVLLCEKHSDVAHGASGANDGMVHAGIDLAHPCKKLHYVVKGNAMYGDLCRDLGVDFTRNGQYVVFGSKFIKTLATSYLLRAKRHKIPGVTIVNRKGIVGLEPSVDGYAVGALKVPSTGAVSPYKLTIALAENAVQNGVTISLNTAVTGFVRDAFGITDVVTNRGTVSAKCVVNAAGVFADKIAELADDRYFSIHPRKGVDLILDPDGDGLPTHSISLAPTFKTLKANKNTKGGGIVKTVDGNILLGPNAVETPFREDTSTTATDVATVFDKQQACCPALDRRQIIAYFAGVRACTYEEDFLIERSSKVRNLVHVAGIQSPGLTAAPAFAPDVAQLAVECLAEQGVDVRLNANFNPKRVKPVCTRELSDKELDALVEADPDFGTVICRCERVTLGEIKAAINNPLGVATVDGVKRRVRAGMGRCQGGFCMPQIVRIIAEEMGKGYAEVNKSDDGSYMAVNKYE